MENPLTNWREHFPYPEPRKVQADLLDRLAELWDDYEVFAIQAPTSAGKTAISETILRACYSASYIAPTNMLVEQYRKEFPSAPTLSRMDSYWCSEWRRPCIATRARLRKFCTGCHCGKALAAAKYRNGPGVYNYHIYTSHRLYRETLVVDEAHLLIPFIRERMGHIIWKHDANYPSTAYTNEQLLTWVQSLPERRRRAKKIQLLELALTSAKPEYTVQRTTEEFNGRGTTRGEPEDRDCLKLLPIDISHAPRMFNPPGQVGKTILLSATINHKDLQVLGWGRRAVVLQCDSPIPPERRPINLIDCVAVNRSNMRDASQRIAQFIERELLPAHVGEKGIIHATYQMAQQLQYVLHSDRFIFHTRENKADQYLKFRNSPPAEGKVLVCSGMYEGIDLPGDMGRWQVIAKVPWLSLANPAVRQMSEADPDWYNWESLKAVIQACGRICRTESDYGTTYIVDNSFERLLAEADHMIPDWFRIGLVFPGSSD